MTIEVFYSDKEDEKEKIINPENLKKTAWHFFQKHPREGNHEIVVKEIAILNPFKIKYKTSELADLEEKDFTKKSPKENLEDKQSEKKGEKRKKESINSATIASFLIGIQHLIGWGLSSIYIEFQTISLVVGILFIILSYGIYKNKTPSILIASILYTTYFCVLLFFVVNNYENLQRIAPRILVLPGIFTFILVRSSIKTLKGKVDIAGSEEKTEKDHLKSDKEKTKNSQPLKHTKTSTGKFDVDEISNEKIEKLERLFRLKKEGILSEKEFLEQKRLILEN